MKKINLQNLFLEIGYSETAWKGQKSKNLKAIGIENPSETFYLDIEKWADLKAQLMTIKAKSSAVMQVVIENHLEEPKAIETKKTSAKAKSENDYNERNLEEKKNLANKKLLDRIKELEEELRNVKAENLVMKIQLDWNLENKEVA